jgi:hypothetical protein
MIWQFGELGYDYSIEFNGRTGPKPVRWDYYDDASRQKLYKTLSEVLTLRNNFDVFHSSDVTFNVGDDLVKSLILKNEPYISAPTTSDEMNVVIVGNFDVTSQTRNFTFPHTGNWFHFFSRGDQLTVSNVSTSITLLPGEFRVYTDVQIEASESELMNFVRPLAPELASLTEENGKVRITWIDLSTIESNYTIYRKTLGGDYQLRGTVSQNNVTYLDNALELLTSYEYYVEAINSAGSDQSNKLQITTTEAITAVEDDVLSNLDIYPNPTKDLITIDLPLNHDYHLQVLDSRGCAVRSVTYNKNQLDLSGAPSGVYFLKISNTQSVKYFRIVKL